MVKSKQITSSKLDGASGGGKTTQLVNGKPVRDGDADEKLASPRSRRKSDGDADDVQKFRKGGMVKGRC
jgi:hypothetical protein